MKKIVRSIHLLYIFIIEFIRANLSVTYIVLFRSESLIHPQLVDYQTPELTDRERMILAQMITLTPGTITCKIDHEKKSLQIHILDAENPDEVLDHITKRFKNPLREVNR